MNISKTVNDRGAIKVSFIREINALQLFKFQKNYEHFKESNLRQHKYRKILYNGSKKNSLNLKWDVCFARHSSLLTINLVLSFGLNWLKHF